MTDPGQAERERYETDRALADLDTLALRERVRELEEKCEQAAKRADNKARKYEANSGVPDLANDGSARAFRLAAAWTRAALADHREGEDG